MTSPARTPPDTNGRSNPAVRARTPARAAGAALLFCVGVLALDRGVGAAMGRVLEGVRGGSSGGQILQALDHRDADLIVFGSSRTYRHVSPAILERELGLRAFNAGAQGQMLTYARMLEALLLERGTRAQLFALQVDDVHLFVDRAERAMVFAPFYGESPIVDRLLETAVPLGRLKLRSHAYRFNSVALPLLGRFATGEGPVSADGFLPHTGRMSSERAASVSPPWGPPATERGDYAPLARAEARVRGFIRAARAARVECLVFVGPQFRGGHPPHPAEAVGRRALARWVHEEGGRLAILDEVAHPEFRDPALFHDPGHLNARGAERFTALLAAEIRARLARPRDGAPASDPPPESTNPLQAAPRPL